MQSVGEKMTPDENAVHTRIYEQFLVNFNRVTQFYGLYKDNLT